MNTLEAATTPRALTVGSLFSGLGSFDRGLEVAGCRLIWQIENDKQCVSVLARHWPEVQRYGDITDVDPATLPVPDIIVGGFPCQDLSVAGARKGLAGERSGLWYEFHRILRGCHSRWVIVENVDGLLSSNHGEDHAIVLGGLTGILPRVSAGGWQSGGFARGPFYHVAWRVLDAEYFGVAQRRNRVFFVGCAGANGGHCAEVLFESEGLPWHPPPRRETGQDVAATLTHGAGISGSPSGRHKEDDINLVPSVVGALNTGEGTHGYRYAGDDAAQGHFIPSIIGALVGAGGSHGYSLTGDRAAAGHFIPSVARPLRAQAQLAHRADADTLVAGSLTARYGKGADTTAPDPLVYQCQGTNVGEIGALRRGNGHVTGGVPFVAHALTSEGADASEDGTGRGIPLVIEPEWAVRRLTPVEDSENNDTLQQMGYNEGIEGKDYATENQTDAREILRVLRDKAGAEAFQQWGIGRLDELRQAQVLRTSVHGESVRRASSEGRSELGDGTLSRTEVGGDWSLREMWRSECVGRASQEWQLSGQHTGQLGAYLSQLSQQGAPQAAALHDLWQASEGLGLLRDALSEVQEAWRSVEGRHSFAQDVHGVRNTGAVTQSVRTPLHASREGGNASTTDIVSPTGREVTEGWAVRRLTPL